MPEREFTRTIKGADDFELNIARRSSLVYHGTMPESRSVNGLAFVIPALGEDPKGEDHREMRRELADTHGLLVVEVEYHCFRSRLSDGARLEINGAEFAALKQLCARHHIALLDPEAVQSALAQLPEHLELEIRVRPPNGEYQDLGLVQALDHLAVYRDLLSWADGPRFDPSNVMAAGIGYGGYLAHLAAKVAPNTIRSVIDFGAPTAAPLSYLFGRDYGEDAPYHYQAGNTRILPLIATNWSDDPQQANYFSPARRSIRSLASDEHAAAAFQQSRRPCSYSIGYLLDGDPKLGAAKEAQAGILRRAGFEASLSGFSLGELRESSMARIIPELFRRFHGSRSDSGSTPDHVLGSSIAYLCAGELYQFDHGPWGCNGSVLPLPSQAIPSYRVY